jgi:hypothetical protein
MMIKSTYFLFKEQSKQLEQVLTLKLQVLKEVEGIEDIDKREDIYKIDALEKEATILSETLLEIFPEALLW